MTPTPIKKPNLSFLRDRSGVAAVEFAIGAPMMIFALIIMTDLGLAINERMNLDQAVRAGAEFVMNDVSVETDIEKLMIAAATGSYSDQPSDVESAERPTVDAIQSCECPEAPGTAVSCTATLCTNNLPPSLYYQLTASKTYDAILLPDIALQTEILVQVR